jgi:hypothetical protein
MKCLLVLLLLAAGLRATAQNDEARIKAVLERQSAAWNRGSLEDYMVGYWNSDSLMFIGKSGVHYGYQATLENYKKGYPDTAAMGKLQFNLLEIKPLSPTCYFVAGKWQLTRSKGGLSGYFTLVFRKINNQWVIVCDHSS